jgi:transposase
VSTVSPASRHDLTDAQRAVLVPLPPTGRGRPRQHPLRGLVDSMAIDWARTDLAIGHSDS